jgi:hypothetical protein
LGWRVRPSHPNNTRHREIVPSRCRSARAVAGGAALGSRVRISTPSPRRQSRSRRAALAASPCWKVRKHDEKAELQREAEELLAAADLSRRIAEYLELNGFENLAEAEAKGWGNTAPLAISPKPPKHAGALTGPRLAPNAKRTTAAQFVRFVSD